MGEPAGVLFRWRPPLNTRRPFLFGAVLESSAMSKSVIGHIYMGGLPLRLKTGRLLATVEPDGKWPAMYRARLPNDTSPIWST